MLQTDILLKIKHDKRLKNHLCLLLDIAYPTLERWLKRNNPELSRTDVVKFLATKLNKDEKEISSLPVYMEAP